MKFLSLTICFFASTVYSAPVNEDGSLDENSIDAQDYLSNFGYLPTYDKKMRPMITDETLKAALRDYQQFMSLEVTGVLDSETKKQMALPRCGRTDKDPPSRPGQAANYRLGGSRWKRTTLYWNITEYSSTSELSKRDTDETIENAFQMWSNVTHLKFKRKTKGKGVHFEIRFVPKSHGDDQDFDGPGRTIAHAFFPSSPRWGGDVHFDNAEKWTINTPRGINLLEVATHEIGHSLGLDHSSVPEAIMYPTLRPYRRDLKLDADDIKAIQRVYPPPKVLAKRNVLATQG